jgi:hypothetical protein
MEMPSAFLAKRLPEGGRAGANKMKLTKGGKLRPQGFVKVEDGIPSNLKV